MMTYTMDNRPFKFNVELENKEISILKKNGVEFYISREKKESIVIFLKSSPKEMWFDKKDCPELFEKFDKLYKELGELDYRLYGYSLPPPQREIRFFDLRIDKTYTENEFFYHDDFLKICRICELPVCEELFRGSYSLKTLKKLFSKAGIENIDDLLFKPTFEHTFGIKDEKVKEVPSTLVPFPEKNANKKIVIQTSDKNSRHELDGLDILKTFEHPDLFVGIDDINEDSLLEYIELFSGESYLKSFAEQVSDEGIFITFPCKKEIKDSLVEILTELIIETALKYVVFKYNDETSLIIKANKRTIETKIKSAIQDDCNFIANQVIKNYNQAF